MLSGLVIPLTLWAHAFEVETSPYVACTHDDMGYCETMQFDTKDACLAYYGRDAICMRDDEWPVK